jgi:hypothetical protein
MVTNVSKKTVASMFRAEVVSILISVFNLQNPHAL